MLKEKETAPVLREQERSYSIKKSVYYLVVSKSLCEKAKILFVLCIVLTPAHHNGLISRLKKNVNWK